MGHAGFSSLFCPQLGGLVFFSPSRLFYYMWTKSFRNTDDRVEARLYTYETQLMLAGDGTKRAMLMERLCLMHILWPLGPLLLFCFFIFFFYSTCLSLPFSVLVFIPSHCRFTEQLWKSHISTFKYAKKQLSLNKPDGAFPSKDITVGWVKLRRFLMPKWLEARCYTSDLCCLFLQTLTLVCRMWREETPSWSVRSRALRRRWPPARRSRLRRRWRCGASSRSWRSRSATWVTWDRAWPISSLTNHQSKQLETQDRLTAGTWTA